MLAKDLSLAYAQFAYSRVENKNIAFFVKKMGAQPTLKQCPKPKIIYGREISPNLPKEFITVKLIFALSRFNEVLI